ncbi:hypothetical protein [Coprothermobacter platensis]|uniref:hypothetical protein n=1 Tax=Coprothermobacter platensis TaxID=108819 RepID=UPI0012EA00AE|nr:hypothetical protein [Coprothermobacter platensis]
MVKCGGSKTWRFQNTLFFAATNHFAIRRHYVTTNRVAVVERVFLSGPQYSIYDMSCCAEKLNRATLSENNKVGKLMNDY